VKTQPRLGRGLNALLSEGPPAAVAEPAGPPGRLAVAKIKQNPYQPRKAFDPDELGRLSESIKNHGILQPLVVRKVGDEFQLIAGERRLRAAQAAGLGEVPVHVVAFDDRQVFEAALVENIQRSDLNAIEKARGFKEYLDKFGITQEQLAAKLGLDRTTVSNLLGLLNLVQEVQDAVRNAQISMGHAKILKGIADPARQVELCKETIMKGHSVHALEAIAKEQKAQATAEKEPTGEAKPAAEKTAHVKGIEDDLRQRLAVRVEIKVKAKDRGQIVLGFDSNDDFERLLDVLKN
jgi:ParB family chromosome partitioning protein